MLDARMITNTDCSERPRADQEPKADKANSDYRTLNAESIRLIGESSIDKCIRVAVFLRRKRENGNFELDLPNPMMPKVFHEIDITTLRTYLQVVDALEWLEAAAIRTYRKSRKHALHRLYSNLERESSVPQRVFRDIRHELTLENSKYIEAIAATVLRKPVYDPSMDTKSRRKLMRTVQDNVITLRTSANMMSKNKTSSRSSDQFCFDL